MSAGFPSGHPDDNSRSRAAIIGVDDPWCQQICTEITAANRRTIWPGSSGRAMGRGVYHALALLMPHLEEASRAHLQTLAAAYLPA